MPQRPKVVVHKDGNKTNNRLENLEEVDNFYGRMNTLTAKKRAAEDYSNVCYLTEANRYLAYVVEDGNVEQIGLYDSPQEAAEAYNRKVNKLPEWIS